MNFEEKRKHPRHHFLAEIRYRSNSPAVTARITDLSEGGMFIDTVNPLEDDIPVAFSFHIPDDHPADAISGRGRVAWGHATVGMGIQFLEMEEAARKRVKAFLESL